jgi:hypothetical protein
MTYEGFLKNLKLLDKKDYEKIVESNSNYHDKYRKDRWSKISSIPNEDKIIEISWETGGVSGGSCWDDSDPQPYTASNIEPEFDSLRGILEKICPEISYLKYKKLMSECLETSTYTYNEWYGNCTNYAIKRIKLKKLYDWFIKEGIIKND